MIGRELLRRTQSENALCDRDCRRRRPTSVVEQRMDYYRDVTYVTFTKSLRT